MNDTNSGKKLNGCVLVTGGAGYIGSHVVKTLGENGLNTVVYDNLSTGHKDAVTYGEFVEGDLEDTDKLRSVFKDYNVEGVMHFAGSIVVPESVSNPAKYYSNNTLNSLNLIKTCLEYNVKRFIFSSTAAVYGLGEDNLQGIEETSLPAPINPYGSSKLMTETMLRDISKAHDDFNFIALRYFNVAGADFDGLIGQRSPNATHLIKVALKTVLGLQDKFTVFGDDYSTKDGSCIRDFIHVVDLAMAHLDAFKYLLSNEQSHILNCGYGHGFSVKEVIEAVKKVTGKDFNVVNGKRRAGDPPQLISNPSKIKELLGWTPKHDDLELIIKTAYSWERKLQNL